jgi:hypothetical protein
MGKDPSKMESMNALWMRSRTVLFVVVVLVMSTACSDSETRGPDEGEATKPDGRSLFVEGCPEPGKVRAVQIDRPDLGMWGPQVLGGEGDFLLINDQAAFIITNPEDIDAYWYYGGILVDAVALNGCEQAGPERYQEFLPLAARLDIAELLTDFNLGAATLRGFRGEWVEILNNGADGEEAIVRIHGTDDTFWTAEYTMIVEAFKQGAPRPLSSPFGIEMFIDYVLSPDSPVLRIEVHYRNLQSQSQTISPAAAHLFGSTTDVDFYNLASVSTAGFRVKLGAPWITSTSRTRDGALTFAMEDAILTTVDVAGVDAVLDFNRVLVPLTLGPEGSDEDTKNVTYFMSVGKSDGNSAERPLHKVLPQAYPWAPYALIPITGTTFDTQTEEPIAGVALEVQLKDIEDVWRPLHRFYSDASGIFSGAIADFGDSNLEYRITAHVEGRHEPEPILFTTSSLSNPAFGFGPEGVLAYEVQDGQGRVLPARITLWQEGRQMHRILAAGGTGEARIPPGTYDVSVTRGYEYETFQGSVTILPSTPTPLGVQLTRVVDTAGFLSVDGHLHAAPSPDSQVSIPDRIRTAATEGLEVVVSTDHEFIGSWQSGIDETGLDDWVATIPGCELTATVPEHLNIYSVEPRFDLDARGGYIRWYGLDIAEIYALARERGAEVISLNHPGYLRLVEYDRITGEALLDDPTAIGLRPDAELWSWNFDVIEYMNGHKNPFVDPESSGDTGYFEDWMSFLNLGHPITAMGTTDLHGLDVPGQPRTYFASSTDAPREFDGNEFIASIIAGRCVVSDGAFARVEINGSAALGDLVTDVDGSVDLAVHIEAIPEIDVTHFLVFVNCDEVLKVEASDPNGIVKYDGTLVVPAARDAHVVVVAFGANRFPRGLEQFDPAGVPRFTTNAIYVDADGNGIYDPQGGKTCSYDLAPPT